LRLEGLETENLGLDRVTPPHTLAAPGTILLVIKLHTVDSHCVSHLITTESENKMGDGGLAAVIVLCELAAYCQLKQLALV
jgi:hypothetical protein